MDPLSISVSALAIIGALNKSLETAKSFYHATDEIDSLHNDLAEAELMIREINASFLQANTALGPQTALESSFCDRLKASEVVLLKLKDLVENESKLSSNSATARRLIWLRVKRKAKSLRKKLAEAHSELPRRLGQLENHRIRLELNDISLVQEHLRSGVSRLEELHSTSMNQHLAEIHEIQETQAQSLLLVQRAQTEMRNTLPIISAADSLLNQRRSLGSSTPSMPGSGSIQQSGPDEQSASNELPETQFSQTLPFRHLSIRSSMDPSIVIQGQYRPDTSCRLLCPCKCHIEQTAVSPTGLIGLLGQAFVGYKALPGLRVSCTDPQCDKTRSASVNIRYFFPQWWLRQRAMLLCMKYHVYRGPVVAMEFPRVVSYTAPIFLYTSRTGSLQSVKDLFSRGLASPNDISDDTGHTPLHNAISYRSWPIVEFLVAQGSDLKIQDSAGLSPAHYIWYMIFDQNLSSKISSWLSVLVPFPGNDLFGFSKLHLAVIGIESSIEAELRRLISTSETIDDQDLDGRTALFWAAGRGDVGATELLLQYGANPNIRNNIGKSAVQESVLRGKSKCLPILLSHGADPYTTSTFRYNALHYLATSPDFSIETADLFHSLHMDLDSRTKIETPVLFLALENKNYEYVKWLLAHNVNYRVYHRGTFVHYVGWYGSIELFNVIREAGLTGIDVHDIEPDEQKTALGMLTHPARNPPATPVMVEVFTALLDEIEERTMAELLVQEQSVRQGPSDSGPTSGQNEDESGSEDELFMDAIG